jgi:alkylation response protein AidB-like acyl-CoA dehydrogenase
MVTIDLDVDLTDEERAVRDMVHKFAEEVLRPAGRQLDALPDPADVIKPDSILWDVFKKHRELGLDRFTDPGGDLTPRQQARLRCVISEEMGWGDAGLAISLGVNNFPRMLAQASGKPELVERFGAAHVMGCWAGTEPDHGSDCMIA